VGRYLARLATTAAVLVTLTVSQAAPARAVTAPSAPGVSTEAGLKIIVDNDFALLAGDSTNVSRLIYNNNYEWGAQVTNAATLNIELQSDESYLYLIPMGGGGDENFGGKLGGVDITAVEGAQRATGGTGGTVDDGTGYLTIQSKLSYNAGLVSAGTFNVTLSGVQAGLSGATWGSAVYAGGSGGNDANYNTSGVSATQPGQTRKAWAFPSTTAVAFRYPLSSVALPPSPGDRQVQVFWSKPTNNGGEDPTDYVVQYRTTSGPGEWQTFADGTSTTTSATVTGLTNGTSYDFQVAAVNSGGTSGYSTSISATPRTTPGAPQSPSGTPSGTQVALTWSAPASDGGSSITDYVVQYRTSTGPGEWQTFTDGVSTATSATVTGLTNGTSYDFQVAAKNGVGTGDYSGTVSPVWGATVPE
jgi:hypothetical protein